MIRMIQRMTGMIRMIRKMIRMIKMITMILKMVKVIRMMPQPQPQPAPAAAHPWPGQPHSPPNPSPSPPPPSPVSASCRAQHPGKREASKPCRKQPILLALLVVLNIVENKKPANHAEKNNILLALVVVLNILEPCTSETLKSIVFVIGAKKYTLPEGRDVLSARQNPAAECCDVCEEYSKNPTTLNPTHM